MDIVKIGFIGLVGVLIACQFKVNKPELSVYLGAAVSVLIFAYMLSRIEEIVYQLQTLEQKLPFGDVYFGILLKGLGITYVSSFCSGICRDAGYSSIATQIEIFGKMAVLLLSLPIAAAVIEIIGSLSI